MPRPLRLVVFLVLAALVGLPAPAAAQEAAPSDLPAPAVRRAPQKAFALSLVLPGLGHRYAHGGSWRGAASGFALGDAALWTGLLATLWRRDQLEESFETLAATRAAADVAGKDRTFFLNLASFRSSDAFLDAQLRNRAWDRVAYVSDPSFQWAWTSEADFQRFRDLREDHESLGRRRSVLAGVLVGNRLLAALLAARATGRANRAALALSLAPPPPGSDVPRLDLRVRF